jgi:hypothetical protein
MRLKSKHKIIKPNPEDLLESVRSFGYSIATAIADLIDNSVSAESTIINIDFVFNNTNSYVRIEDNGIGMSQEVLEEAMRLGSSNPNNNRKKDDLGRFGLGLKTASFSQCKRLTVVTKSSDSKLGVACWDLDYVAKEKEWFLLCDYASNISKKNVNEKFNKNTGTIILWENLDKILEEIKTGTDRDHFYRKIENVKVHIGLVFHKLIEQEKLIIYINGSKIKPINPFTISEKIDSLELQEEILTIKKHPIIIQPYILPHESKYSESNNINRDLIKGFNAHQGIYIYRNDRLIIDGGWLDLDIKEKESQRLCRVSISIDNSLDKEWQIEVQKSKAKIPDIIRKEIKLICQKSIERAVKVYSFRGAYLKRTKSNTNLEFTWMTKSKNGKKEYELNKNHFLYNKIKNILDDNSELFVKYISMIEQSIPIGMIVNDFSDHNLLIKDLNSETIKETNTIYESLLEGFMKDGMNKEEAIIQLEKFDLFQNKNRNAL